MTRAATSTTIDTARGLRDLEAMLTIRRFEERVYQLRMTGSVIGSVHLANGQEAIAVGACDVRRPSDPVFATYRGHSWAIACGADLVALFAELMGREGGTNAGRGGSAYLSAPDVGFYGENSIVAAGLPIANGAALAARFGGSDEVPIAVFGDGATNQGAAHEAFNFAAAMKLGVIFLCENNGWAELTPIGDTVGESELWKRAAAYGRHAERIDGNDVDAVRAAVGAALERARRGDGPSFIEAMTQRIVGHYIGDPETYRTDEDRAAMAEVEPIAALRRRLAAHGVAEEQLDTLDAEVTARVKAASNEAKEQPLADVATVREHVRG
jgi:TPP-dependent pyruvate/acetoin dehydrogenase alpha subunit